MQQKKYLKENVSYKKQSNSFVNNKKFLNNDKKVKKLRWAAKTVFRNLRHKPYGFRSVDLLTEKQAFSHKINILFTSNNIFCNLSDNRRKRTLIVCTSGKYKVKISKKRINANYDSILNRFFQESKKIINKKHPTFNGFIFTLVCATRMRKKVLKLISSQFKHTRLLIKVLSKKTFNGCRPKKKIRKKRSGLRVFK